MATNNPQSHNPSVARMRWSRRILTILLWRALTVLAFVLGVIGAFLPIMPTVPFLLLSAWAASKGWPQFEQWLLTHRLFGPSISRWRAHGAVSRGTKWLASVMMLGSALLLQAFTGIPLAVRIAVPLLLLAVAIWLWLRPEQ